MYLMVCRTNQQCRDVVTCANGSSKKRNAPFLFGGTFLFLERCVPFFLERSSAPSHNATPEAAIIVH